MGGFFSLDGAFYKYGSILADMMILSFWWLLFSLPIVTIGASTTAAYYVTTKRASKREGYIWKEFWGSFKENIKQSTGVYLIVSVLFGFILFALLTKEVWHQNVPPTMATVMHYVQLFIGLEVILIYLYVFPIISRFSMSTLTYIKTSFFMVNKHLLTTITIVALLIGAYWGITKMPPLIIVIPGAYFYLSSMVLVRIFKKYRPDLDPELEDVPLAPLRLDEDGNFIEDENINIRDPFEITQEELDNVLKEKNDD